MKTLIVGGGKGCRAIMAMLDAGHFKELAMEVICVVDPRLDSPGVAYAREHGVRTEQTVAEVITLDGLELVLELTGDDVVLDRLYHLLPAGVRLIDHASARLFWEMAALEQSLRRELGVRIELEERLASDRKRLQGILDSLPDMVVVLAEDKRILMANERFRAACGRPLDDVLGHHCSEVFCTAADQERRRGRGCPFDDAVRMRRPVATIVERELPQHAFFEVTASPQFDRDGRLVEVVETHHPVTERILLRREVETSEQRFRQFIDSAHDIISIKDRRGRYLVVNPASAALFGKEPLALIGRTAEEVYAPEIAATIVEHDRDVVQRGAYSTFTEHYVIDGKEHWLQTTRFPLFDYAGEIDGVCTIARDITEQRQLQGQILQSSKLAAVGKLAAGVAHEINNPLTGVLAFAEALMEDTDADDPRAEDYAVIIRETLRCRDIVRNLLDFARQEEPRFATIDLNGVVDRSLALVAKLPRFHDVRMETRLSAEPLPVYADARQLQQVLLNLIINANDAMGGRGAITVASERREWEGACVLSVRDTGPGVPAELRPRIFEPFYSTKSTSGLGLAVSWGIVERHGGTIEIDDAPGGGAEFRVVLPLGDATDLAGT